MEKFTDFLRLFVSVHLRRIESSPQFPIVDFLALLFKYTFNQVMCLSSQRFGSCEPHANLLIVNYISYFFFSLLMKAILPVWIFGVCFWIF